MSKKLLATFCSLCMLIPTGTALANTSANISIIPGNSGVSDLSSAILYFDPYTIGTQDPAQNNTTTTNFTVIDYSGTLNGWTVSVQFSDFVKTVGNKLDKLSDHNGVIKVKCASSSFKDQVHSCNSDFSRDITSSGTAPIILAAAASKQSVGTFNYSIPAGLFELSFDKALTAGEYAADLVIDFSNTYTP